jgi:hypothetical protein
MPVRNRWSPKYLEGYNRLWRKFGKRQLFTIGDIRKEFRVKRGYYYAKGLRNRGWAVWLGTNRYVLV